MTEPVIVCDPNVMMGKPVVAGTRITVELIRAQLSGLSNDRASSC